MPMRQLRTCDFCGDDAAGVYEVLPPELSPTEAEQHRVVLCSDCLDTLEAVTEPLLDRLGVDSGATESASGATESDSGAADVESDATDADSGTPDADRGSEGADAGPSPSETVPSSAGRDPIDSDETAPDDPFDPVQPEDPPASRSPSEEADADGAVQWDDVDSTTPASGESDRSASSGTDTGDTPGVEPGDDSGPTAPTEDADDAEDADTDGASEATEEGARTPTRGRGETDDEPDEFRTVMRLLGNREFPVERAAIVDLAVSAYELDEAQVDRILDHAVERGVLVDEGGTLKKD